MKLYANACNYQISKFYIHLITGKSHAHYMHCPCTVHEYYTHFMPYCISPHLSCPSAHVSYWTATNRILPTGKSLLHKHPEIPNYKKTQSTPYICELTSNKFWLFLPILKNRLVPPYGLPAMRPRVWIVADILKLRLKQHNIFSKNQAMVFTH